MRSNAGSHEIEVTDMGRLWVTGPDTKEAYPAYVTLFRCGRCGLEGVSRCDEQMAFMSGDVVAYRAREDAAMLKAMYERECTLGLIRTARGVAQMR